MTLLISATFPFSKQKVNSTWDSSIQAFPQEESHARRALVTLCGGAFPVAGLRFRRCPLRSARRPCGDARAGAAVSRLIRHLQELRRMWITPPHLNHYRVTGFQTWVQKWVRVMVSSFILFLLYYFGCWWAFSSPVSSQKAGKCLRSLLRSHANLILFFFNNFTRTPFMMLLFTMSFNLYSDSCFFFFLCCFQVASYEYFFF